MKLERMLSIVVLLLNRRIVQARELAEMFEVSVRTIYRDIEAISQAGIPVTTYQGTGGGIGLVEGYRLDRNLLTERELATIATALRSLSTSEAGPNPGMLLEKITSVIPASRTADFDFRTKQLVVDLSGWGRRGMLEDKLDGLRRAIESLRLVSFAYCSAAGDVTLRTVEPHTLVLKRQSWYLYAYCREREQFRLFKLFRMKELALTDEPFERRPVSPETIPWNEEWLSPKQQVVVPVKLRFTAAARHVAEEWFGVDGLTADESNSGGYIASAPFPEDNWLYGFILSFGPEVEVLEPFHLRARICEMAAATARVYGAPRPV